ncbi:MAG: lamin tail domain-containing protein [Candidatus Wildermuthbacteria bacterium]|nr:lamin tail domain-containing protein [Candidatus Wildermuthbacteria bacterium]
MEVETEVQICSQNNLAGPARSPVIINEVAWMGTLVSANDEWIELKNLTNEPVVLSGWQLLDKDEQIAVVFEQSDSILANGFYLLERTDDSSVADISASKIYTGGLNNTEESLRLFNNACELIDEVIAEPDWPGGNNETKDSLERGQDLLWHTYYGDGENGVGTPGAENSAEQAVLIEDNNEVPQEDIVSSVAPDDTEDDEEIVDEIIIEDEAEIVEEGPTAEDVNDEEDDILAEDLENDEDIEEENEDNATEIVEIAEVPQDTSSPTVVFGELLETQNSVFFVLSWVAEDKEADDAPVSGVSAVFVSYVAGENTGALYYEKEPGAWEEWISGEEGVLNFSEESRYISLWGRDEEAYSFFAGAEDGAGNQSGVAEVQTSVKLLKSVVINEIAWMGTGASASDEWLELHNPGTEAVDISGWRLVAGNGTPDIIFPQGKSILAGGYFFLERTDDTAVFTIATDHIYTGALGNDGEELRLYNADGVLVDIVDSTVNWFAGSNSAKQTMERISSAKAGSDPANWASNNLLKYNGKDASGKTINGTPRAQNSVASRDTRVDSLRWNEFDAMTLTKLGQPYYIPGSAGTVPQGKTLTVEPGVTVRMNNALDVQGTLRAIGDRDNEIVFTKGDHVGWCGLKFAPSSVDSELSFVRVKDASSIISGYCNAPFHYAIFADQSSVNFSRVIIEKGNEHQKLYLSNSNSVVDAVSISGATWNNGSSAIYVKGGSPVIKNSTISGSYTGISVGGSLPSPVIQNNIFLNNTYPVKLNGGNASLSGNTAQDNAYNGIYVEGGIAGDMTLEADAIPYLLNSFTIHAGATLTLKEGVDIKFITSPQSGPQLTIDGKLLAQGTQERPVEFGPYAENGWWKRMWFTSTSSGSVLEHAVLRRGGSELGGGALFADKGSVDLKNVTIQNSGSAAIRSYNGAITGSFVSLVDNPYAFRIALGACPVLTDLFLSGNASTFFSGSKICSF